MVAFLDGIGVVDLMIGLPSAHRRRRANLMSSLLLDQDSKSTFQHAASYMYKNLPDRTDGPETVDDADRIGVGSAEMDTYGIERGLIPVSFGDEASIRAGARTPPPAFGSYLVDPNLAMEGVRDLERGVDQSAWSNSPFSPVRMRAAGPESTTSACSRCTPSASTSTSRSSSTSTSAARSTGTR